METTLPPFLPPTWQPAARYDLPSHHYPGNTLLMKVAESRITAQGQVSVPAEVRRLLGLAPGSILEWSAEGDAIVVRRAHRHTTAEVHHALFQGGPPERRSLAELKAGIAEHMRGRHARR